MSCSNDRRAAVLDVNRSTQLNTGTAGAPPATVGHSNLSENGIGGRQKVARTFEIRLYRDSVKAPWKNLLSSDRGVEL
jgi:hypothetical protein